ncbi:S-adenosyl-L-methionine-dependent methyltransferase [Auriscalpium vulgare]|uniref:S-adenosyl-L-methionine-dependent methyltransferase n=1 Tax=Auriscalpium vulgare TaxID=40419 RepID=A0ACB8RSW0_9AGAM|nr:S-adenosyl-L-methionine-dependent methyltransferase [Auriscalpium vulgare]
MSKVTPAVIDDDPSAYETKHVHEVYDQIASHFSSTRYKPWPIIAAFLASLPPGWVGLDSGTGNGKYLPLPLERPGSVWTIGLDRSRNLLDAARNAGGAVREVVWGDVLGNGWRIGAFDYAISIATIHHLATPARRREAVERLLQSVSPSHGRVLIYVWAIEQDALSKRQIPTTPDASSPGAIVGEDVYVPWVLNPQPGPQKTSRRRKAATESEPEPSHEVQIEPQTFHRYYHMFAEGELDGLVNEAAKQLRLVIGPHTSAQRHTLGVEIVQSGWERSNHYVEVKRWQA